MGIDSNVNDRLRMLHLQISEIKRRQLVNTRAQIDLVEREIDILNQQPLDAKKHASVVFERLCILKERELVLLSYENFKSQDILYNKLNI